MEQAIVSPAKKVSPKDVFLHLLMMVTLYASAASVLTLLFQYINLGFPDNLNGSAYYAAQSARQVIRWAVATLVVVFPTYLFTTRALSRDYNTHPEKRDLRIRKWLVYFTLFVAGLIAIGDVVSLVYTFLGGEITIRFVLKVLSIFIVMGSIFFYYLMDIKKHHAES